MYILTVELSSMFFYLDFDRGFGSFLKQLNEVGFFWIPVNIKHDKNRLEMR